MAFRISLLPVLLFCFNAASYAQERSYPEVMRHLYGYYKAEEVPFINVAHKPGGWVIQERDYSGADLVVTREHLLCNRGSLKWNKISLNRRKLPITSEDSLRALGYNLNQHYRYERCAVYGYPQWSWDMIQRYGNELLLSPRDLEGLSRAYSEYAVGFISPDQWGEAANSTWPGRQGWKVKASTLQVDSFEFYCQKGLSAMQKLRQADPNYEVLVGNIRQKMANEYMFMFQVLVQAGHPERARKWACKADYDPAILDWASLMLKALPPGAILISGGDNDTYPIWYLQQCRNIRRDVALINVSLLALKQYRDMITEGDSSLGRVRMNAHTLHKDQEEAHFVRIEGNQLTHAEQLLELYYGSESPGTEFSRFLIDSLDNTFNRGLFDNGNSSFLTADNIHLMDLMLSNRRKVLFTAFNEDELAQHWESVVVDGPHLRTSLSDDDAKDSLSVLRWLDETFTCIRTDSLADERRLANTRYYTDFAIRLYALALDYAKNHGNSAAIDRISAKIPCLFHLNKTRANTSTPMLIGALYRCGKTELADRMLREALDDLEKQHLHRAEMRKKENIKPEDDALRRYGFTQNYLDYLDYELELSGQKARIGEIVVKTRRTLQ
ncbi:MAG: hypothetical protein KJS92_08065 [Bacteroidetes bacterium]|nr:hypothetical protein [Bacteroidota bacterium]